MFHEIIIILDILVTLTLKPISENDLIEDTIEVFSFDMSFQHLF